MNSVSASTTIAVPPEKVWELMSNPDVYPEVVTATDRVIDKDEGPMRIGYVYHEFGGIPPFKSRSEWRVTEYQPFTRQVHVGNDGSMTLNLEIDIAPANGGSRLTQTLSLKPRPPLVPLSAILWPLFMKSRAQKVMDDTVRNFRQYAEASG